MSPYIIHHWCRVYIKRVVNVVLGIHELLVLLGGDELFAEASIDSWIVDNEMSPTLLSWGGRVVHSDSVWVILHHYAMLDHAFSLKLINNVLGLGIGEVAFFEAFEVLVYFLLFIGVPDLVRHV